MPLARSQRGPLRWRCSIRFIVKSGLPTLRAASGRTYPVGGNNIVDVPYADGLAIDATQATMLTWIGATADRPGNDAGRVNWPPPTMYDTTLSAPIFLVPGSAPARWMDINGNAV